MKYQVILMGTLLAGLAASILAGGCAKEATSASSPVFPDSNTALAKGCPGPSWNFHHRKRPTPTPRPSGTPAIPTFTPTPTPTVPCGITPVACGPLPVVYPYGWGPAVYEQEPACAAGVNDSCPAAQALGSICSSGLYVMGNLSSVGQGGADRDFYSYTEGCLGAWHIKLDCTNGSIYQMVVGSSCGAGTTVNSGTDWMTAPGGSFLVEVLGSSGTPGPYRLCIWREGLPTPTPAP